MKTKTNQHGFKDKSKPELLNLLKELQTELLKIKMDFKVGKLKDVHLLKKKRKEIARIKTFITVKEITVKENKL